MDLDTPISSLPKTSPITIRRLKSIGINTYWDLINYFPFRYENFSLISPINKLQPGELVTIQGQIIDIKNIFTRRGLQIQKVTIRDNAGQIEAIWYNQPYLIRLLKQAKFISLAGETRKVGYQLSIESKSLEFFTTEIPPANSLIHTGRIVPVYPERNGLTSKLLREKIFWIINQISQLEDFLPKKIISYNNLSDQLFAYKNIHFPKNNQSSQSARERLAFDELFVIQLSVALTKREWEKETSSNRFDLSKQKKLKLENFINHLPFRLTTDQLKSLNEIKTDLIKAKPMNRFLQGDVGSGKTVIAAIACFIAYLNGYQSLLMAPTEILAEQHYQTISNLFVGNGFKPFPTIILITGSVKPKLKDLQTADIIIGTHALLNKNLIFKKVAFVVIDEQHRFGVSQRAELKKKAINPHLLTMTATPIPRTIALTLYGELDISYINTMPKGRLPVKTYFVPNDRRLAGYDWIKKQITSKKNQVFVICPLIEESEEETMKSVKAAEKEYSYLKNQIFPDFNVGLLHGRIKPKEKDKVMKNFKNKIYDILVATPIVEVGIDIANATVMIIEGAERYGLAQLHQLRGRVGRGVDQSYCFLFTEKTDPQVIQRLKFFSRVNSGIKLAEYDLKRRGPGEVFGTRQHGFINLKIASLTDFSLINQAKKAVNYFINHYSLNQFSKIKEALKNYQTKQISRD